MEEEDTRFVIHLPLPGSGLVWVTAEIPLKVNLHRQRPDLSFPMADVVIIMTAMDKGFGQRRTGVKPIIVEDKDPRGQGCNLLR